MRYPYDGCRLSGKRRRSAGDGQPFRDLLDRVDPSPAAARRGRVSTARQNPARLSSSVSWQVAGLLLIMAWPGSREPSSLPRTSLPASASGVLQKIRSPACAGRGVRRDGYGSPATYPPCAPRQGKTAAVSAAAFEIPAERGSRPYRTTKRTPPRLVRS